MSVAGKRKPIALITDDVATAVTWAHNNLKDIQEISPHRRFIATPDQDYIICTDEKHLIGMEISDYRDVGGRKKPSSFYIRMFETARSRMR